MKLCERCKKNPAAVPDRMKMGRPIKRICIKCADADLMRDLEKIRNQFSNAFESMRIFEERKNAPNL